MVIPEKDIKILRTLAYRIAEISTEKANQEKADMWSRLTDLDTSVRPMLLTHLWPMAWSQVLPDEKNLLCEHPDARNYERELRQRIWTAESVRDDTVIEPIVRYPHCVTIDKYGGLSTSKFYAEDDVDQTGAAIWMPEVVKKSDIDKLGSPIVSVDKEMREQYRIQAEDIFGDILDVIPEGIYFAAKVIDEWVELRGMEQFFIDMVDDPQYTHQALQRITDNFYSRFTQCEDLGVWGPWEASDPL